MLLKGFHKPLSLSESNANYGELQCTARLQESIEQVLPYLNTVLGSWLYTPDPPSLTLHTESRIIVIHPREIAISRVKDEAEADRILYWLKEVINDTWSNRHQISPRHEAAPRPNVVQLLKLLTEADCGRCGQPSCVAFAVDLAEGAVKPGEPSLDCLGMDERKKSKLEEYLSRFGS